MKLLIWCLIGLQGKKYVLIKDVSSTMVKQFYLWWTIPVNQSSIISKVSFFINTYLFPCNPIKHHIKSFILVFVSTKYPHPLGVVVYYKKHTDTTEKVSLALVDRLIRSAGLHIHTGCVLYVDNYYTSVRFAFHFFKHYKWIFVGSMVLTGKSHVRDTTYHFTN